jgi:hypothetical protein
MRPLSRNGFILALAATAVFMTLALAARRSWLSFGDPSIVTGYVLLALMIGLGLLAGRKRLSMVPMSRASVWLTVHLLVGLLALAVYWLHSRTVWPNGLYEMLLAALFYLVALSGGLGFLLQATFPARLTQSGYEIIYERIPAELARLREAAEAVALACAEETGSDTLARHYDERLHWYFQRPRFFLSHVAGTMKARHWLHHNAAATERYLNDKEKDHHRRLYHLAEEKSLLDFHYALQGLMKWWLFAHIPPATALLVFALWHLLLVNVYAV